MSDSSLLRVLNAPTIRYFYEVARTGSFRQAAEQVRIAASAIHRQVGLLEEQVGTRLFERAPGRRPLKLTAAGEVLAHHLQIAMNEVSVALREIEGLRGVQRGRVAIGTSDVLAADFLPSFLAGIQQQHSRIELAVKVESPHQLIDLLLDHRLDVVLAYDVAPRIGVRFAAEFALPSHVLVPRGHPLAGKRSTSLAECAQYALALPDETHYLRGILDQMFHDAGVKPTPFIATNSFALMRDLVEQGLAIAIQTPLGSYRSARHPNVVYVPLRESLARYSVLACCVASNRSLPMAANLVVESLVGTLRDQLESAAAASPPAG